MRRALKPVSRSDSCDQLVRGFPFPRPANGLGPGSGKGFAGGALHRLESTAHARLNKAATSYAQKCFVNASHSSRLSTRQKDSAELLRSRSAVICGKVVIAGERSSYVNRKLLCGKRSPGSGNSRGGIGTRLYSELLARSTGAAVVQRQLLFCAGWRAPSLSADESGSSGYQGLTPAEFSHLPRVEVKRFFGIQLFSQDTLVRSQFAHRIHDEPSTRPTSCRP